LDIDFLDPFHKTPSAAKKHPRISIVFLHKMAGTQRTPQGMILQIALYSPPSPPTHPFHKWHCPKTGGGGVTPHDVFRNFEKSRYAQSGK